MCIYLSIYLSIYSYTHTYCGGCDAALYVDRVKQEVRLTPDEQGHHQETSSRTYFLCCSANSVQALPTDPPPAVALAALASSISWTTLEAASGNPPDLALDIGDDFAEAISPSDLSCLTLQLRKRSESASPHIFSGGVLNGV